MIKDLVEKNRSYRRFHENERIGLEALKGLVGLARLCPSSANLQPLKYLLSSEPETNESIFAHLSWAGYLKEWPGPQRGERPSAYIIVLGDLNITRSFGCDHGIAAQTILLGAAESGLGGCILSSIDRKGLKGSLGIPDGFEILLAIALGRPKEQVVIEDIGQDGSVKYWRDGKETHHVPKRALEDLIVDFR